MTVQVNSRSVWTIVLWEYMQYISSLNKMLGILVTPKQARQPRNLWEMPSMAWKHTWTVECTSSSNVEGNNYRCWLSINWATFNRGVLAIDTLAWVFIEACTDNTGTFLWLVADLLTALNVMIPKYLCNFSQSDGHHHWMHYIISVATVEKFWIMIFCEYCRSTRGHYSSGIRGSLLGNLEVYWLHKFIVKLRILKLTWCFI